MAKIKVEQAFSSGANDEITLIDDAGRVWILVEDRWVRVADLPDEPGVSPGVT